LEKTRIKATVEAALLAAAQPLSVAQLSQLFDEQDGISQSRLGSAIAQLAEDCADRGVEVKEVASGFRMQIRAEYATQISLLWTERQSRYSRALLETLALIAYRQPITRGEIEAVRGVSVAQSIIKTLEEREWIRVLGQRDVPGRPSLYGTTKAFLDYFNLKSLDELPTLAEIRDLDQLEPEFVFPGGPDSVSGSSAAPAAPSHPDPDAATADTEGSDPSPTSAESSQEDSCQTKK